ncbi:MAG TPA: MFS transporter [Verrucomicrobiae bacterium]|nr:MFS transporter [Verrucomicrobiae bacterium]
MARSGSYKWWVVVMLWFICFFNYADRQSIYSVFPKLREEFGFDTMQLGIIGSAFMWIYAVGAPLAGFIGDRLRRKDLILGGCAFWSFVTVTTGWCAKLWQFTTVRALDGFGETFYFPASMALISDYHGGRTRSRALSFHQSSVYLGTILGSWLGAWFAERHGWRIGFYFFGGMGMALAVTLYKFLQEPRRGEAEVASQAVTAEPLTAGEKLSVGETLRVIFHTPTVPLLMLAFVGANLVAMIFLTWTPTFLVEKFHFKLTNAGLSGAVFINSASALSVPVAGVLADGFTRRFAGGRMLVQAMGLFVGASFVFVVGKTSNIGTLLLAMSCFGLCKGFYDSGIFASLYDAIEPRARSSAAGLMNTVGWSGGALGSLFIGFASKYGGKATEVENMSDAIAFGGVIYLVAAALVIAAMLLFVKRNRIRPALAVSIAMLGVCLTRPAAAKELQILKPDSFAHYVEHFNAMENENWTNYVSNAASWDWLQQNIPFFECPDRNIEEMYYFRWWSFRKHLVKTPFGFVLTEFLTPVKHAGIYNTISCAAGHHLMEGRWLRDQRYLDDYTLFWLRGNDGKPQKHFHKYSSWFAAAVYQRYLVNHDQKFLDRLLNDLAADYRTWEQERQATNGLFWQYDVRDGMEESISGSRTNKNLRPTINSYMFGNARAIAAIARLAGNKQLGHEFDRKARELKRLTQAKLWDRSADFFKVRFEDGKFSDAREEIGFIPWYFELPDAGKGYETAWGQLTDTNGFWAPYGITTAERRNPRFRTHGCCHCEWDGAVWPFATSQTLTALANVLCDYRQTVVTRQDYFNAFLTYVRSQHRDGRPYIGEYLDEITGKWLKGEERSRYYNHSTFADLLITGVVGLRPRADNIVEINPLLPENAWDWFCLDGVRYHGHNLTILWDKQGKHYGQGAGLRVFVDGRLLAHASRLARLTGKLH